MSLPMNASTWHPSASERTFQTFGKSRSREVRELPSAESIRKAAKAASHEIHSRRNLTRRPHQDRMDGQWQFWVDGRLFDHFDTEDECWALWWRMTDRTAAE